MLANVIWFDNQYMGWINPTQTDQQYYDKYPQNWSSYYNDRCIHGMSRMPKDTNLEKLDTVYRMIEELRRQM